MENVKQFTQSFTAIPKSRFKDKLQRTIAGVFLLLFGFGVFYLTSHGFLSKDNIPLAERGGMISLALGGWVASSEFISAPIKFGIAVFKDIWEIVFGKKK